MSEVSMQYLMFVQVKRVYYQSENDRSKFKGIEAQAKRQEGHVFKLFCVTEQQAETH